MMIKIGQVNKNNKLDTEVFEKTHELDSKKQMEG